MPILLHVRNMKRINIILFEPEIAENCGNIIRSCVGFNAKLHLIFPLGFNLYDKRVRRSCVNYFDNLDYETYDDINDFNTKHPDASIYYLTRYGHKNPSELNLREEKGEIFFMFGRESTGIPYDILHKHLDRCFRIPTTDKVRALNISNCVAIILYKATEELGFDGLYTHEPDTLKGEFFIDNFNEE